MVVLVVAVVVLVPDEDEITGVVDPHPANNSIEMRLNASRVVTRYIERASMSEFYDFFPEA